MSARDGYDAYYTEKLWRLLPETLGPAGPDRDGTLSAEHLNLNFRRGADWSPT